MSAGAESTGLTTSRRVARHRDRQQRLDALHRPRRLPHRRRARRAAEPARRWAASSTTPIPNVGIGCGSRAHLSIRQGRQRHASTAASRSPASSPSTATAARAARRPPTPTTRWSTACSASRRRRTSPPTGHIYLQYFPTFNPNTQAGRACRSSGASRRCRARASRASRSTCRPRSSTSTPRSGSSSTTPRSTPAATSAAAWASTPRATSTSPRVTPTRRRAPTATRATTRPPSARSATTPSRRRAPTAAPRTTPTRTRAGPRATPTTTTARCCGSSRSATPGRAAADGRRGHDVHAPDRRGPERPEPVRRHRGWRRQDQARDLRDGPAQPEPPLDRPEDRRPVHGVGRPGRRRAERQPQGPSTYENAAQITHAGNYGWPYCMGNKQPYRDRSGRREPAHRQPGRLRAGRSRRRAAPRAGTTATTCATTRPTTPAWSSSRTRPGTGADAGKVRGNNLWYSRGNPGNHNGCPDFPRAARRQQRRPNYGATPVAAVPVRAGRRHDDHGRPGLPLQQGRGRQLQALARVLGRPLVPAQQRRPVDQARPAAGPGHGRPGRPAGLRRQPARHAALEQRVLHGLQVRHRRRALRADLRRVLPRGSGRQHLPLRLRRRRADAERGAARVPIGDFSVRFSSAALRRRLLRVGVR